MIPTSGSAPHHFTSVNVQSLPRSSTRPGSLTRSSSVSVRSVDDIAAPSAFTIVMPSIHEAAMVPTLRRNLDVLIGRWSLLGHCRLPRGLATTDFFGLGFIASKKECAITAAYQNHPTWVQHHLCGKGKSIAALICRTCNVVHSASYSCIDMATYVSIVRMIASSWA